MPVPVLELELVPDVVVVVVVEVCVVEPVGPAPPIDEDVPVVTPVDPPTEEPVDVVVPPPLQAIANGIAHATGTKTPSFRRRKGSAMAHILTRLSAKIVVTKGYCGGGSEQTLLMHWVPDAKPQQSDALSQWSPDCEQLPPLFDWQTPIVMPGCI
jgi:hypothetical protein